MRGPDPLAPDGGVPGARPRARWAGLLLVVAGVRLLSLALIPAPEQLSLAAPRVAPTEGQVFHAFFHMNPTLARGALGALVDGDAATPWPLLQPGEWEGCYARGQLEIDGLDVMAARPGVSGSFSTSFRWQPELSAAERQHRQRRAAPDALGATSEVGQDNDPQAALLAQSPVDVAFTLRALAPGEPHEGAPSWTAQASAQLPGWRLEPVGPCRYRSAPVPHTLALRAQLRWQGGRWQADPLP